MSGTTAQSAALHPIRVTVNATLYEANVEPRTTLVDFLRHDLGLTGTHVGCEHGVCGACTVLINGDAVRSCITLAVQADASDVTTVEGLSAGGELHPLQEAFIERFGMQCGFCTPGFLMSVLELLQRNAEPTQEQIWEALGGNICRCTGYEAIVDSVKLGIERMRSSRTEHP
jgi:carbon-monoxide dehydrogenase small subunit